MNSRAGFSMLLIVASLASAVEDQQVPKAFGSYRPTDIEIAEIQIKLAELSVTLPQVEAKLGHGAGTRDLIADVEVCRDGVVRVVELGEFHEPSDASKALKMLDVGLQRAKKLSGNENLWAEKPGSFVRGYRSKVDGSVQPYAVIVSSAHLQDDRNRLDVVLHGRDARLTEVRFFDSHNDKPPSPNLPGITLHVFGRGNNAYRWAGEADVREAIAAVKRNYRVDDRRIVLRGFSMGGAGAWHLGLHDPSQWSSVEAGAGFAESIKYAKLNNPSEDVRKGLHIYDAVDYAVNAFNVPMVGYGGENDPQAQASKEIESALISLGFPMKTEGLVTKAQGMDFVRIVGKGMGHAVDKDSAKLMKDFHATYAEKEPEAYPRKIRFATYTLKYNRAAWLTIKRLNDHYRRATIEAETDGELATVQTENIRGLAISRQVAETVRLDGQEFPVREAAKGLLPDVYFLKSPQGWELLDHDQSLAIELNARGEKCPGLQGPIDDAFTAPFLCVRGTGRPLNLNVQEWAEARLQRFADQWTRNFRGRIRIKADVDVTEQDIEENHLILFGDPGSNRLIARLLPSLALGWTESEIKLMGSFSGRDHVPVMIQPNPLNLLHYVVLNSGHTFGAEDYAGTNALLYPHLSDYAVIKIGQLDQVVAGGFFDERWKKP